MLEIDLLRSLGLIIVGALTCVLILRQLSVPNIVAYIIAGLLLGPVLGLLDVTTTLDLIAEFGIVLLLFLVGLELSISTIKDIGKTAFVAGGVQMTITAAGGAAIAYAFGLSPMETLVVGVAVMFSSTVVVIKLLETRGDLNETYGRIAVGVLLVQDLVVVIVLTLVAGLGGQDELALADIATGLGTALVGMAVLGAVVVGATMYVLPKVMGWISSSPEGLFIWSLFWCFLVVEISELLNLSPEIGAFLAGIALAQLPFHDELRRRVHPLMNLFIVVFFVSLGIQMELGEALAMWPLAVTLAAFVMIVKPLIFFWVLPRLEHTEHTSFLTGITLAQISEFSLIFAALALSAGLIDTVLLSLITLVGLITFGLSAFLIIFNKRLYAHLKPYHPLRLFGARQEEPKHTEKDYSDHVIIVGMNTLGRRMVDELRERGHTVVPIDTDRKKLQQVDPPRVHGDATDGEVMHRANLADAKLLISTLHIEEPNEVLAVRAREAGVPCSVHSFDPSLSTDLLALDVDYLIHSKRDGIQHLRDYLLQNEALST